MVRPSRQAAAAGEATPPTGGRPAQGASTRAASRVGLDTAIGSSGLPGAATLRRHGRRLGISTVRDLLTTFPRRYEDLRESTPLGRLAALADGTPVTARVTVASIRSQQTHRRRLQVTTAILEDESGEVEAVWFGRRFIERQLRPGDRVVVSGKVKTHGWRSQLANPEFQRDDGGPMLHAGRIVPIYGLTRGVSARTLRTAIRAGLDRYGPYPEYLPASMVGAQPGIGAAMETAHFPDDFEQRDAAVLRLAHDELLALQIGMVARRRQRRGEARSAIVVAEGVDRGLQDGIEAGLSRRVGSQVALTVDQRRAMAAIRADLAAATPMLRLIQGDVGSGKTAVAAYALGLAASGGGQGALLAPTDLLARQLAETVADLLTETAIPVTLLTGSLSSAGRRAALESIATGQAQVVVGTHALLQQSVAFGRLDLVVVDEQHRFGVAQREALAAKGFAPHVMLMTATPIPRTLGQVLYADLDVSDLRAAPAGRTPTRTGIRRPNELSGTWDQVRREAAAGGRTFVVVPHIDPRSVGEGGQGEGGEEGDEADDGAERPVALPADAGSEAAIGAEEVAARLRVQLAPLRVGLVHGRLRADERDA
ncbi:MAG TPA: DEAD/DEAH box helicase, partial [Candidatus Limnocylindrales bacterium]|nr:DEAD/DEAH box helicase [Candidatus Limnocylindrales bacterium]